ncbi:MAG: hypothetical protein IPP71_23580 [Bacteroidetes bacterium]|nr:hypothetical protein [Bacteroidota bacterium]
MSQQSIKNEPKSPDYGSPRSAPKTNQSRPDSQQGNSGQPKRDNSYSAPSNNSSQPSTQPRQSSGSGNGSNNGGRRAL